jgi:hypothetical protein
MQKYGGDGIVALSGCVVQLDAGQIWCARIGSRGRNRLQLAHYRHSLVILAISLGELTYVRRLRWSVDTLAQVLGLPADARRGFRLGPMSSSWLRQHESEFSKHGSGQ